MKRERMDAKFLLVDWDAVSEPGLTEAVGVYEKGPYGNGIDAACTLAIEPHQEVHLLEEGQLYMERVCSFHACYLLH